MKYFAWLAVLLGATVLRESGSYVTGPTRFFLHLTDTHLDRYYAAGAPNRCLVGTKLGTGCCRADDVAHEGSSPCGPWGDLEADAPPRLVDGIIEWIAEYVPRVDAVFQTGDDASHHDVTQTIEGNLANVRFVAAALRRRLGPGVPIFNAVGNHDTYPIDQTTPLVYGHMLREIGEAYGRPGATHGFYSEPLGDDLQVVALNSIWYDSHNAFRVRDDAGDARTAGDQFAWLGRELASAHAAGRRVVLLTHIPIGGGEATPYYDKRLAAVLLAAPEPPLIQLCGHEHYDHFYLYFADPNATTPFSSVLAPNSIVPSNNFPGFRVYEYDSRTRSVVDYTQFACNLIEANNRATSEGSGDPSTTPPTLCAPLYRFRELYGTRDVSTASLAMLYTRMGTNTTLLATYVSNQNFGEPEAITDACVKSSACLSHKLAAVRVDA